jgi:hypothetical protein
VLSLKEAFKRPPPQAAGRSTQYRELQPRETNRGPRTI